MDDEADVSVLAALVPVLAVLVLPLAAPPEVAAAAGPLAEADVPARGVAEPVALAEAAGFAPGRTGAAAEGLPDAMGLVTPLPGAVARKGIIA